MKIILTIALGGAVGAVARYLLSLGVHGLAGYGFPYGTLIVNVVGSFFIGLLYVIVIESESGLEHFRAPLMVGLLGAFTTFSAFSLETIHLIEARELFKASANILLNIGLCITACWAGLFCAR